MCKVSPTTIISLQSILMEQNSNSKDFMSWKKIYTLEYDHKVVCKSFKLGQFQHWLLTAEYMFWTNIQGIGENITKFKS